MSVARPIADPGALVELLLAGGAVEDPVAEVPLEEPVAVAVGVS